MRHAPVVLPISPSKLRRAGSRGARLAPAVALAVVLLSTACKSERDREPEPRPPIASAKREQRAAVSARARGPQPKRPEPSPTANIEATPSTDPVGGEGWGVSELFDVGPAGPATATKDGIVMVTKADEVLVVKRRGTLKQPNFGSLEQPREDFARYARGPSVLKPYAYWIHQGRLLRRRLDRPSKLEVLTTDAREGARVSAARTAGKRPRTVATYLARTLESDRLVAKLWVEAGPTLELTPDGSAASSVAVLPAPKGITAVALEGRTSMAPVHVRRIQFEGEQPKLSEDRVIWVGPPAQPLTELTTLSSSEEKGWALIPLEKSITTFGLAQLPISEGRITAKDVDWRLYPNGLDPAPVAAAQACGKSVVVYARPSEAKPRAPQELHIAALEAQGLTPSKVLARSRAFANVSVAGLAKGLVVAWVADHRTWAVVVECTR